MIQDMSKCFTINEQGDLLVDQTKIDPSAVKIKSRHIMSFTELERKKIADNKKKLEELKQIL